MTLKAVIFDFDGTLANTLPSIAGCGNTALLNNGLGAIPQEEYNYLVGEGADRLIHNMLAFWNADNEELYERVRADYIEEYSTNYLPGTVVYEGIEELLDELKRKEIYLAVLSNKPHEMTQVIANELFGSNLFEVVFGKQKDVPRKPDPKGVELILEQLAAAKEETIFLGDTSVDIQTAKNAGLYSVGAAWGFRGRQELMSAGADKIIEKPAELLELFS